MSSIKQRTVRPSNVRSAPVGPVTPVAGPAGSTTIRESKAPMTVVIALLIVIAFFTFRIYLLVSE